MFLTQVRLIVCYSMYTIRDNNCKCYFVSNPCTKECQYKIIYQIL